MKSAFARALALMLAALVGALAAPACSSSTTNPGNGANCDQVGQDCVACCTDAKGGIAATAYTEMVQRCACDSPTVCVTECAAACGTPPEVTYACVSCMRLSGSNCANYQCNSSECKDFKACVATCK